MPSVNFNSNATKKIFFNSNQVKKLFLNGNQVWQDAVLPIGIIIGYSGLTAPSGWSLFSSANDKLIVGAGGSYAVNTTGGSNSISKDLSTTNDGAHTGTTFYSRVVSVNSGAAAGTNVSAGGHNHTLSVAGSWTPLRHQIGLIKALIETNIPNGGIIFSASDISSDIDAVNVNTESAFLSSNNSGRIIIGSDTVTLNGTTSSTGSHNHNNKLSTPAGAVVNGYYNILNGTHTHTSSITISPVVKSKFLAAWSNALEEISICSSVIGMWEDNVAPEGWAICDGTNGTPDLRDYFIRLSDVSNAGNIYNVGGDTIIPSTSVTSSGSHNHLGTSAIEISSGIKGECHSNNITHTHTTVADSVSIVPTYYALTFIMKL